MTTNYGERPGIVVDDSDQFLVVYDGCAGALRWGRREAEETRGRWAEMSGDNVTVVSVSLAAQAPSLLAERDALQEQVAQLREALGRVSALRGVDHSGRCNGWTLGAAFAAAQDIARAALAATAPEGGAK